MTAEYTCVSPNWLALREPADATARSPELAEQLGRVLPSSGRHVIHDLGCGAGAMGRWLAPRLPGPQHWLLHDRDADLLEVATAQAPGPAADGSTVTLEAKLSDLTKLAADDLADATLITASALLDMLTAEELSALVTVCAGARCPILLTLTVVGRVELIPPEPLDGRIAAAFNSHQRRMTGRGRLLGPDAVALAVKKLGGLGAEVFVAPSPWRLSGPEAELAAQWCAGWVRAACEQQPELTAPADGYRRLRLAQAGAGQLDVTVEHADVLALPRSVGLESG